MLASKKKSQRIVGRDLDDLQSQIAKITRFRRSSEGKSGVRHSHLQAKEPLFETRLNWTGQFSHSELFDLLKAASATFSSVIMLFLFGLVDCTLSGFCGDSIAFTRDFFPWKVCHARRSAF